MQKRWEIVSERVPENGKQIREILLKNRKIQNPREFFSPPEPSHLVSQLPVQFPDLDLRQLEKAVDRIKKAISAGEKITVWGDYDVDGICATAVLWQTLHGLGADVLPYIPDRFKEGYGLNSAGIQKLAQDGRRLIITVDSGITAREEAQAAKKAGVDLIITDHHLLPAGRHGKPEKLPSAFAIVHTTKLCGTGVAWLLASQLSTSEVARSGGSRAVQLVTSNLKLETGLDLVAIATVADLQPLLGVNRALVKRGFEVLNELKRPGLAALVEAAGLKPGGLGSYAVGWVLGPRINAVGRLRHGIEALRLLCISDSTKAHQLAQVLNSVNTERQVLTAHTFDHAKGLVDGKHDLIVVYHDSWHEGIIGLVAGKIAEEYGRPAVVIAKGKEFSKGSARSVNGINIVEVLRSQEDLLEDVGGHEAAAGFTIKSANLEKFVESIRRETRSLLANLDPRPVLKIDLPLPIDRIDLKLAGELEEFAPYGVGNPEPIFVDWGVRVLGKKRVGRNRQHLKLALQPKAGGPRAQDPGLEAPQYQSKLGTRQPRSELCSATEAIWFSSPKANAPREHARGGEPALNQLVSIAYTPQIERWQGKEKIVLKVRDLKTAS